MPFARHGNPGTSTIKGNLLGLLVKILQAMSTTAMNLKSIFQFELWCNFKIHKFKICHDKCGGNFSGKSFYVKFMIQLDSDKATLQSTHCGLKTHYVYDLTGSIC